MVGWDIKTFDLLSTVFSRFGLQREHRLLRRIPREARVAVAHSETARLRGNQCESARYLRRALEICPDYPDALNRLGVYWHNEGHDNLAGHYFRKAMEIDPNFDPANQGTWRPPGCGISAPGR